MDLGAELDAIICFVDLSVRRRGELRETCNEGGSFFLSFGKGLKVCDELLRGHVRCEGGMRIIAVDKESWLWSLFLIGVPPLMTGSAERCRTLKLGLQRTCPAIKHSVHHESKVGKSARTTMRKDMLTLIHRYIFCQP